jgi:hypothetical protein
MMSYTIRWKTLDQVFKLTKSTPQDMLDWINQGLIDLRTGDFICNESHYLGKYFFETQKETKVVIRNNIEGSFTIEDSFTRVYCKPFIIER